MKNLEKKRLIMGGRGGLSPAAKAGKKYFDSAYNWIKSKGVSYASDSSKLFQNLQRNAYVQQKLKLDFGSRFGNMSSSFNYKDLTISLEEKYGGRAGFRFSDSPNKVLRDAKKRAK